MGSLFSGAFNRVRSPSGAIEERASKVETDK